MITSPHGEALRGLSVPDLRVWYERFCGGIPTMSGEYREQARKDAQEVANELTRRGKTPVLTVDEQAGIQWAKSSYGVQGYRRRLRGSPDDLPERYRRFYWHPFGVPEWNQWTRYARTALAKMEGREVPPPCPYQCCASGAPPEERFTVATAARIFGVTITEETP